MKMKERTTANHEHADAGTFTIYYKGAMTGEAGIYSGYASDHTRMYHQATISHNGLIVYDASKLNTASSDKTIKWYSGGQRWPKESYTLEGWLESEDYTTGVVTGRQHAYTDDTQTAPLYAYIAGDITKAYPSETVDYVGRRMLTVYTGNKDFPTVLFVYDDITSDSASYEKRFLFHINSSDAPTVNGNTVITEEASGRIVLTCLSDNVSLNQVGGRVYDENGKYNCAKSSNYLINGIQNVANNNLDDGHWGRIEIVSSPAEASRDAKFMNVIYVTDKGQAKAAPAIAKVTGNGVEGGTFGDVAAIFATSRDRVSSELSFTVSGGSSMNYYVSGVAAGNWKVTVDGKDCGSFTASEDGGLLTFTAPAGSVKITPAK